MAQARIRVEEPVNEDVSAEEKPEATFEEAPSEKSDPTQEGGRMAFSKFPVKKPPRKKRGGIPAPPRPLRLDTEDKDEDRSSDEEDTGPWYDDEEQLCSYEFPSVHQILARLIETRQNLRGYFYGNPKGCFGKSIGTRRRKLRRKKVMRLIDAIMEEVEFDDFLDQTDSYNSH